MMQTIIDISNVVAPFGLGVFIIYICIGWILFYFKRHTLIEKYFFSSFESNMLSGMWLLASLALMVFQLAINVRHNELTPLGFMFLVSVLVFVLTFVAIKIVNALIAFRDTIKPE
jgi:hypothetical protein